MKVEGEEVSFTVIPTRIVVRPKLSKARHKYFTFLGSEGCEYLKAHLEKRLAVGEELMPLSAMIAVKSGCEETGFRTENRTSGHLTTKTITKEVRDSVRPSSSGVIEHSRNSSDNLMREFPIMAVFIG